MSHCQLCYCSLTVIPGNTTVFHDSKIEEIVSSCNKHLSKDLFTPLNFNLPFFGNPFCEECETSTLQLLQLDIQLEQINTEIKTLVSKITEKISNERQNYQLINSQSHFFSDAHKDNTLEYIADICDLPISQEDIISESLVNHPAGENISENIEEEVVDIVSKLPKEAKPIKKGKKRSNLNGNVKKERVTSTDLLRHKISSSEFACPKCNKKFTRLDILNRHECGTQTYECETCGKSFSSHGSLSLHKKIHTGEKPHKCETCGKGFTLPHHLRLHILTHTGERPHQCDICKKSFKDKSYLIKHKVQHSTDEMERRKYKCEICSKTFTLQQSLKFHLVLHTGDTKHKCKLCGKICETSSKLRVHEVRHTKEKKFKCEYCWKSFTSKEGMTNHSVTHTEEKNFQCETCGKSYHSASRLRTHNYMVHLEQGEFMCHECGKHFKNQAQLNQHLRKHAVQQRKAAAIKSIGKGFKCDICGNSYADSEGLFKHQKMTHVVRSTNRCEKCGTEIDDNHTYYNHSIIKMGKNAHHKYNCRICNERFPSRCDQICHYNSKHTISEYPYKCTKCKLPFIARNEFLEHRKICNPKSNSKKKTKNNASNRRKKEERDNRTEDNDELILEQGSHSTMTLRRSNRVKKFNKDEAQSEESADEYDDDTPFINSANVSSSENEKEDEVQIKMENDVWVKDEPHYFSD